MKKLSQQATGKFIRLATPLEQLSIGHHSGPGLRIIFWVQGCSLLCTRNCLNPHLLKAEGGYLAQADVLTQRLLNLARDYSEVEGVTVLGGEPFDQAGALADALSPIRSAGLSVMVYSGHTLESLREMRNDGVHRLLGLCDILVDGPFLDDLYDESLVWRGSMNQKIVRLSDYYSDEDVAQALESQSRAISVSVGVRGDVLVSGAQNPGSARRLRQLSKTLPPSEF